MRSTRKSEGLGCLVGMMTAIVAVVVMIVTGMPPERPPPPRWAGAGSDTPNRGGAFIFHHESNVRGMDPHISFDELSNMAIRLVFDGLLDYDAEASLVPSLAEAMPEASEDGQTFTFRLRRGVRFQDCPEGRRRGCGRELVAEDVRWSIEHMMHHDTGCPGFPFFLAVEGAQEFNEGRADHVRGIEVIDRYTIRFHLNQPDQTFLNAMAMTFAYPVPHENYEFWGADVNKHPIGVGPFRLDVWERGVQLVFVRNRHYWREGLPYVNRMVFLENLQRHLAIQRFLNGDLDAVHRFTLADYVKLNPAPEWADHRSTEPDVNIWGLVMNTEIPPFDDVHVRRAVAFAIDREGWDRARAGRLLPTGQPLPPQLIGYDAQLPSRQFFDLDRAREEMRLAGHPVTCTGRTGNDVCRARGLDEEIVLWVGEGETGRIYGQLAQSDLARIGLRVRLRQVAFAAYLQMTAKRRTVQIHLGGWSMDFPDPADFLDILFHSHSIHEENAENRSFYSNPELDSLLDRARAERDREARTALYRQASEIVARDAPWAFLWVDTKMEMWQPYVRNYRPHPVWSQDYRFVWLDEPRRRVGGGRR